MDAKLAGEFPKALDGIEIWAVPRQVIQLKLRFMGLTPSALKVAVVVFGASGNDACAAPAWEAAAVDQAQESPGGHPIKAVGLTRKEEFTVVKASAPK